jgi:transcriptional regulator with XRE-family HTH domain
VSKLEEGRVADPKSSTLVRIAKVLGCTVAQLMAREK